MTAPADLPTGTVTFLFTDIEGSTRLLQELGEEYRAVQDRHAELVREANGAEGGHEVRTEGDSFFAAFPTPAGAVRAAVAAQRSLAAERWPHGGPLRVRMGLHTGEGVAGGDDYLGIDVNRAARIAAAGHGGQVLISGATRGLVEHALPEGVALRDLGTHRLKDIDHPEHLHDLVIDGLNADFPPIRTLDARRTNLPAERTSFVGREGERARIAKLLGTTRLLTLTGPGGTGKTRLALKVAADQVGRFGDGVFLVDLSTITDLGLVSSAMAAALGVREDPGRDLLESLVDHLRERQLLLVLDNFEQVVDAAPAVDRLLAAAPRVTVLVTSRIPLRLSAEQEYQVPPLALPDAARPDDLVTLRTCESVMLFVDRATAVRPGFRLTEEIAPSVSDIVARVDGLPLALELAAGRVKVLSPPQLLGRLGQRLPVLTGGARDLPERQRTLRAAIEWSHDLLDAEEQRLFARLAVFAGAWSLDAAEAVCGKGLGIDVLDGLTTLIDNSLVRQGRGGSEETRFRMLQTIREFAGERLEESEEADEIRRRHTWHVVALAEAAEPELVSKGPARLDQLEEEHDNVRAALRWSIDSAEVEPGLRIAGALWRFWHVRGHLAEGRGWTDELLSLPAGRARTAARAKALGAKGSLAYYGRDPGNVRGPYEESLAISRELGDREGKAEGAYNLAFACLLEQDRPGAKDLLLQAGKIYRALDDPVRLAHVNTVLAQIRAEEGDLDRAEPLIEEARSTFVAARDLWGIAFTSGQLAALALRRGDLERARTATLQSLETSLAMGVRAWNSVAVQGLAVIAIRQGNPELGVRLAGAADRLKELSGGEAPPSIVGLEDPLQIVKGLPQEQIDALWEEGRAMSLEEAAEQARRGA
jgi:predicted ATPase/class 3 adenylate cyclase